MSASNVNYNTGTRNNDNDNSTINEFHYGTSSKIDMPVNPKMNMDEDAEEVTRKIAPTMFMPSLGPMPTMPTSINAMSMGSTTSTSRNTKVPQPPTNPSHGRYGGLLIVTKDSQSEFKPKAEFVWNILSAPTLPEFHPLEQTAVFVPKSNPSEVASRISSVLRERSIEAKYDNAKAKVKCMTTEGVDFRIRLYRGRGLYNHGIIVEVQRRFGTSLVFRDDTKFILDGAQGKVGRPDLPLPPTTPPTLTKNNHKYQINSNSNNLPQVIFDDTDDDNDDDNDCFSGNSSPHAGFTANSSLTMVAKMMQLSGFDSQYLGLQTLSPLVDSDKLSSSTARAVATELLQPENEVGEKVFAYITNDNDNNNSSRRKNMIAKKSSGLLDEDDDDDDDDNSLILRNMCLDILSNSLRAYGTVPDSLTFHKPLRHALLQDLKNAEKHPNTALLSAKCLEHFAKKVNSFHELDRADLCEAFEIAQKVGEERHASLMRQAQECMIAIR